MNLTETQIKGQIAEREATVQKIVAEHQREAQALQAAQQQFQQNGAARQIIASEHEGAIKLLVGMLPPADAALAYPQYLPPKPPEKPKRKR